MAQVSVEMRVRRVDMDRSPWRTSCTHEDVWLELLTDQKKRSEAQEGLTTTTACLHEVQGRGLAGDRHVRFSVHDFRAN